MDISRHDAVRQQSSCLQRISQAHIVRRMPAKPPQERTPEQRADTARLKAAFTEWQEARKADGLPWTQDEIAAEFFTFEQSALSQYLTGAIPLNATALLQFCRALRVKPESISPEIVAAERARAAIWSGPPSPPRKPRNRKA